MRLADIVCELYWVVRVRQLSPPNRGAFHFCVVRALLTPRVSFQLSLSACSDPQQAWEGPRGSLTAVLCEFLGQHIFLEYDLLCSTDKADMGHSEKPLPIISFPYVPRQVRHSPLLTPPPICLSAYLIEFSPFLASSSMIPAVRCMILPSARERKAAKALALTANSSTSRHHS